MTSFVEISKLWCLDSHQKAKKFKYQRSLLSPKCEVELVEYISLMSLPILFRAKKFLGEKKTAYSCQTTYLSVNKKVTFWGGARGKIWHVASKKPQDHALFFHSIYIRTVTSYHLLSTLLIQIWLFYGPSGQDNMHSTVDFYPRPVRKETNVHTTT